MKCQILFIGKSRKNITNLSSAELASYRVVKVVNCIGGQCCLIGLRAPDK